MKKTLLILSAIAMMAVSSFATYTLQYTGAQIDAAMGGTYIFPAVNADNLKLDGNTFSSITGNIVLSPVAQLSSSATTISLTSSAGDITLAASGTLVLEGQYWPAADGNANEYLQTDGSAQLSWVALPSGGLDQAFVELDDWNMDTTVTLAKAHGLSGTEWKTIRAVHVFIRNDDDTAYYQMNAGYSVQFGLNTMEGISSIDATNINMLRATSGRFDGANFNATTYNRGWIYIEYTAD